MKHILEQDYYELLDITRNASRDEIQWAYQLVKQAFREDSLAIYSLYDPIELALIQRRIEEAYKILMDEGARSAYDLTLQPSPGQEGAVRDVANEGDQVSRSHSSNGHTAIDPELEVFLANMQESCSGKLLRRYREWRGIKLEQVARETKINMAYLQSIEADHYPGLPHAVYLHSYLTQYAGQMGIDPKQVVAGYLKRYQDWKGRKPSS